MQPGVPIDTVFGLPNGQLLTTRELNGQLFVYYGPTDLYGPLDPAATTGKLAVALPDGSGVVSLQRRRRDGAMIADMGGEPVLQHGETAGRGASAVWDRTWPVKAAAAFSVFVGLQGLYVADIESEMGLSLADNKALIAVSALLTLGAVWMMIGRVLVVPSIILSGLVNAFAVVGGLLSGSIYAVYLLMALIGGVVVHALAVRDAFDGLGTARRSRKRAKRVRGIA